MKRAGLIILILVTIAISAAIGKGIHRTHQKKPPEPPKKAVQHKMTHPVTVNQHPKEKAAVQRPVDKKPVVQKPVGQKPVVQTQVQKPVFQKLEAQKPVPQKQVVQKPFVQKPIVHQSPQLPQIHEMNVKHGVYNGKVAVIVESESESDSEDEDDAGAPNEPIKKKDNTPMAAIKPPTAAPVKVVDDFNCLSGRDRCRRHTQCCSGQCSWSKQVCV